MYLPMKIHSQWISALVDSGSSGTYMSRGLATLLDLEVSEKPKLEVTLPNGSVLVSNRSVTPEVEIGKVVGNIKFRLLDMAPGLILGLDWMEFARLEVNFGTRLISMVHGESHVEVFGAALRGYQTPSHWLSCSVTASRLRDVSRVSH